MSLGILDPFIESRVDAYEVALAQNEQTALASFLPAPDHEKYREVVTELIRVDMDLAWSRGQQRRLEDFRRHYPEVFDCDECRQQLAFEEFRLRRQAGDDVSLDEYEKRLQVDTDGWSSWLGYDDTDDTKAILTDSTQAAATSPYTTVKSFDAGAHGEITPGSQWHGFHIVDDLGEGSFGRTYLARQASLADREVVLKFSQLDNDEANKLARLQHTNITPIFSVHAGEITSVICMPFLGRVTLADVIGRLHASAPLPGSGEAINACLSQLNAARDESSEKGASRRFFAEHTFVESCLWMVARLADGLQHCHERGILHRDVKPANILIREDGEPLLIDFNLAVDRQRFASESAGGTIPYMSPEQILAYQQGSSLDARSDIYSLGVVLYELLTGHPPYPIADIKQAPLREALAEIHRRRQQHPPPPHQLNAATSPAVAAILRRCLAANPQDRYQTAAQLRDDIQRHLDHRPLAHAANDSLVESTQKWIRRHPTWFSYSTAAVVICLVSAALLVAWRVREQQVASVRATDALHRLETGLDDLRPALTAVGWQGVDADAVTGRAEQMATAAGVDQGPLPNQPTAHLSKNKQQRWNGAALSLSFLIAKAKAFAATRTDSEQERNQLLADALKWSDAAKAWDPRTVSIVDVQRERILRAQQRDDANPNAGQPLTQANAPAEINESLPELTAEDSYLSHLLLGLELADQQQWPAAINAFRAATRKAPQEPACWLRLADGLMQNGKLHEATACFNVCVTLLPNSEFVVFQRGLCHLANNTPRQAIADFSRAIELKPDLMNAYLNRALASIEIEDQSRALSDVDHVISHGTDDPRVYLIRAKLRRVIGQFAAAREDLTQARQLTPHDEFGWIDLGLAELNEHPDKALDHFRRALALNPSSKAALQNIAHVLSERLGDTAGSLAALEKAHHIDEADTLTRAGRGVLLARMGRKQQALEDAEFLISQPIDGITRYQVACMLALVSEDDAVMASRAIAILAESLLQDPSLFDFVEEDPDLRLVAQTDDFQSALVTLKKLKPFLAPSAPRETP